MTCSYNSITFPIFSSLHFIGRTPSPTSKVEFPPLDFINEPLPFSDTSPYPPPIGFAYHSPGVYSNQDFSVLRRLPSLSDYREEMTTFSSLPTSHFTLKPSSSDTELDEAPMSYWNHSVASDKYLDSSSWSWNQSCTGLGNEKLWQRQLSGGTSSSNSRNSNSSHPPHLSLAPSNYGGNYHPNTTARQKSNQQVQNYENTTSDQNVKDVSRSSLSVTNSKTIILTNTPTPTPHPAATVDKRKVDDKMLNQQQQQNHKLVSMSGLHKRGLTPSVERSSKKPLQDGTNPVVDSKSSVGVAEVPRNKSADEARTVIGSGGGQSKGSTGNGGGGVEQNKMKEKGRTAIKETPGGSGSSNSGGGSVGGGGVVGSDGAVKNPVPEAVGTGSSASSTVPNSVSSNHVKVVKEKPTSCLKRAPPKEPVEVDVWEVNGPANMILSLNASSKREKTQPKRLKKKPIVVSATLESAKLVTSKFGSKPASKKREGSTSSLNNSTTADMIHSLPPPQPQAPGGILIHTSANSRSGSSTPTILNSLDGMLAQQKLGTLSTAMATGLSGVKVTELPSTKTGESTVVGGGGGGGLDVKRTNANSLPDGIVGHMTSQVDHVTTSVGTNGTNFQDMFTTKRKLSESTERGLKQALAG